MLEYIGSDWGGWSIRTDLIRNNSYILSGGLANDITFDVGLLKLNPTIKIIGIDPTPLAEDTVNNLNSEFKDRYIFINKALHGDSKTITIGGDANSILTPHRGKTYEAINLNDILNQYDISILKLDIEGSEYSIIENLNNLSVDQVCIEWHHWLGNKYTVEDTIYCIEKIKKFGYNEEIRSTKCPTRIIQESLFIKDGL